MRTHPSAVGHSRDSGAKPRSLLPAGSRNRASLRTVEAGLEAYDPDDVPPATDVETASDPADTEEYQEETAMIRRQMSEGELYPLTDKHPFPPTRYQE